MDLATYSCSSHNLQYKRPRMSKSSTQISQPPLCNWGITESATSCQKSVITAVEFPSFTSHMFTVFSAVQVCPGEFVLWAETDRDHPSRMFVLFLVTLLFSVKGNSAGPSRYCFGGFCITLGETEITAEAGLCTVIPCSFTTGYGFRPQHLVWFKCEPHLYKCADSDVIFHTNKFNKKVQAEYKGRVSLLEGDLSQRNCSIVINDLTESDSGAYQLRVNGFNDYYQRADGFTFSLKALVSVKGLTQKPTVTVPPLTEEQQSTLTCTAPGLCSGSDPEITWMWRGTGGNHSHITGNVTSNQGRSSTLTFNASAVHHSSEVTCKVSFTGDVSTEETVTLNVTYVKEVKITGNLSVKEGETLNLTCSVESFPPSLITWTASSDMQNGTEEETAQEESGVASFIKMNITTNSSGQYICTAKHLNNTFSKRVDVRVIYMRTPVITGNTTVIKGGVLNLTCSVESFPSSQIAWMILDPDTNLLSGPDADLQGDTASASLVIHNADLEHSGRYTCAAKHLDVTVVAHADVTVIWFPGILANSGCEVQSEVLTCVCVSEGFPLPTIDWPLVKGYTQYSITNTVSNHTVNSTLTLTVRDHGGAVIECVSGSDNGVAKKNLTIKTSQPQITEAFQRVVSWMEVSIAFLIGVLLTAAVCCLAIKCYRKKQKSSGILNNTLQMMTSQKDPLIDAGAAVEEDQTYYQEATEEEEGTERAALDLNNGPTDVEYASIDFAALQRKIARDPAKKPESTETEYAEIKKGVKEEREDEAAEEGEVLEGKEEQEQEEEEMKQCIPEEEDGEDTAVYSNVKAIMGEM